MPTSSGFQVNEILTAANTNTYLLRPYTNAIINGGMNIAQRATSQASITGAGYYTADRWFHNMNAFGTWTDTVQALTSSDAPLQDGVRNSLKITCTTANASPSAGAYNVIEQRFEGFNLQQFAKGTTNARNFALSFWVRTNRTGTYIAELVDTANNRTISATYTVNTSGSWQKVRIVFSADITGLIPNDNQGRLQLVMWLGAGSTWSSGTLNTAWNNTVTANRAVGQVNLAGAVNNYWEMTAAQLEPNNVCTPFEVRQYGEELMLCYRYYVRETYGSIGTLWSAFGNSYGCAFAPPSTMRIAPSSASALAATTVYTSGGSAATLTPSITVVTQRSLRPFVGGSYAYMEAITYEASAEL